jgi:uncharacterized delta-60 repeat protein
MKTILLFFCCFAFCSFANAQYHEPGTLDSTFGTNGISELKIYDQSKGFGIALQPDGKFVCVGSSSGGLTVIRCNADGSLDHTFASGGVDTLLYSLTRASSVTIQPDGKIVVAGYGIPQSSFVFIVIRYNPDGSKDATFGTNGIVFTQLAEDCSANAKAVTLQPDGKIVVAGECTYIAGVAQYNANGTLDNNFNDSGKVLQRYQNYSTVATGILLQNDGSFLVTGMTDPNISANGADFLVMRLKPNGRRDSSFGTNGAIVTDFSNTYDYVTRSALLPDGKFLLAGYTVQSSTQGDFAIVKYNSDGSLDNTFGASGKVTFDIGGDDAANALAIQSDGKIVLGGYSDTKFAVARFNANGSIDNTFGVNGIAIKTLGTVDNQINDMTLQPDGKIVVLGFSEYPPTSPFHDRRFALLRYTGNWASGIDELQKRTAITVTPNPTRSVVHIAGEDVSRIYKAQLIASDGRMIQEITHSFDTIIVTDIPAGFYLLRLSLYDGGTINKPLIIQP